MSVYRHSAMLNKFSCTSEVSRINNISGIFPKHSVEFSSLIILLFILFQSFLMSLFIAFHFHIPLQHRFYCLNYLFYHIKRNKCIKRYKLFFNFYLFFSVNQISPINIPVYWAYLSFFWMSHPGLEPGTTWLKVKCSTTWASGPQKWA